jgi:hypothetical protein
MLTSLVAGGRPWLQTWAAYFLSNLSPPIPRGQKDGCADNDKQHRHGFVSADETGQQFHGLAIGFQRSTYQLLGGAGLMLLVSLIHKRSAIAMTLAPKIAKIKSATASPLVRRPSKDSMKSV